MEMFGRFRVARPQKEESFQMRARSGSARRSAGSRANILDPYRVAWSEGEIWSCREEMFAASVASDLWGPRRGIVAFPVRAPHSARYWD